jgi:hypothetical protein
MERDSVVPSQCTGSYDPKGSEPHDQQRTLRSVRELMNHYDVCSRPESWLLRAQISYI